MQKATNYVRGSVRLEVEGPYPERFFNICSARGIRFWRVERVDDTTVRLNVALSQAKQAQALGPKCLCDVRRIAQEGAPSFLMRFRTRYGMLAGLVLSLLAVILLSRFVLVIDITGDTDLPEGVLLAQLRESGLYPGVYGPSVDARAISNRMLLEVEELGFLSVNLHGIRAEVVVRDADPTPEVEPTGATADLVAEKSGQILNVLPLAGTPQVQTGDWVDAGDTLISGTVTVTAQDETTILNTYSLLAKGMVWAQVEETFSASTPLICYGKCYTGETSAQNEVVILGKSFKISPKAFQPFSYYDKITETYSLSLAEGLTLPLSRMTTRCEEYSLVTAEVDHASAEAYLRAVLEQRLHTAVGEDGKVLSAQWQVEEKNGALTVTVTAQCREQIAISTTKE